ncbi:hypothetical protein [Flavihumibacter sp. CACIAM 22H1]|uniref:hypothetical protein n=1 Tax=Flavihumibacter sp. CACIAM 22H1 TaxID=1812911 RepID=UPI0025C0CA14|nr:hypothetical protein [Flavihumibacter sp. CACIAM 22H1]
MAELQRCIGSAQKRLTNWVNEETGGRYQLSMESLQLDPVKETLLLTNLLFEPTQADTGSNSSYRFRFKNLLVKNVSVTALLESSILDLSTIVISGGSLEIKEGKATSAALTEIVPPKKTSRRKKVISAIHVDSIQLSQLDIAYINRKKATTSLQSVHLDVYNFHSDSLEAGTGNPLPVKGFRLSIENIAWDLANKQYRLSADQFILIGSGHLKAIVRNVQVLPSAGKNLEALAAQTPVQQDVYFGRIPEVLIDSVDYRSFLDDSILRTPLVVLKEPHLSVFNDRSRPPATASKIGKNPHQLIQQISIGLDIPRLQVENGRIEYSEKNKDGTDVGKLIFGAINGNAGPIRKGFDTLGSLNMDLDARLMDKIPLHAGFYFPPGKEGRFTVNASLQPFDLSLINPIVEPLTNVAIRSGRCQQLECTLRGNDHQAGGAVVFVYEDLKIDLLKDKKSGETVKRPLLSLLANQLLLRTNNRLTDRHPHQFQVTNQRDPTKSFFNLVWKTLFEGLKMSTGVNNKGKKPA